VSAVKRESVAVVFENALTQMLDRSGELIGRR
jgi:hypothetical protein